MRVLLVQWWRVCTCIDVYVHRSHRNTTTISAAKNTTTTTNNNNVVSICPDYIRVNICTHKLPL